MIILRQKEFSTAGRIWAGTKGAMKGAGIGALIGCIVIPLVGSAPGLVIGGYIGARKAIDKYKLKEKLETPEGREEVYQENLKMVSEESKKNLDKALSIKVNSKDYILKYEQFFGKQGVEVPESIKEYIRIYSKFLTPQNINKFYSDLVNHPENYVDKDNPDPYLYIPAFFDLFPCPADPKLLEYYDDPLTSETCITLHDNADDTLIWNKDKDVFYAVGDRKHPEKDFRELVKNWTKGIISYIKNDNIILNKDQESIINLFINKL